MPDRPSPSAPARRPSTLARRCRTLRARWQYLTVIRQAGVPRKSVAFVRRFRCPAGTRFSLHGEPVELHLLDGTVVALTVRRDVVSRLVLAERVDRGGLDTAA